MTIMKIIIVDHSVVVLSIADWLFDIHKCQDMFVIKRGSSYLNE